jgi:hypothetical protein
MTQRLRMLSAAFAALFAAAAPTSAGAGAGAPDAWPEPVGPVVAHGLEPGKDASIVTPFPPAERWADGPVLAPRRGGARAVVCDPFSFPEGESNCGLDGNGLPNDTFNGGCSSFLEFFSPILCGDIICGSLAWSGVGADTDWYEITLVQQTTVTWSVTADFEALIGIANGTGGVPDCSLFTGLNPFAIIPPGETREVTACLGPGTWWFVVGIPPDFQQDPFPCGTLYEATLSCASPCVSGGCCLPGAPCQDVFGAAQCEALGGIYQGDGTQCVSLPCVPPANDDCVDAELFVPGDTLVADLRNATLEGGVADVPSCAGSGQSVGTVWYRFVGQGGVVRLSTCGSDLSDPDATDSVIAVYRGTSCPPIFQDLIACDDDTQCGTTGRLTELCFTTIPGEDYLVQVAAWDNASRGTYIIETESSSACSPPEPVGGCCFPDVQFPFCFEVQESQCEAVNGDFFPETLCLGISCDTALAPPNGICDDALLLGVPDSVAGDLQYAPILSDLVEDCGLPNEGPSLWYSVFGNGKRLTVSLCDVATTFDAQLHVFCAEGCATANFDCVAANDNALSGQCGLDPEVSWCSAPGQEYLILVTGKNGAEGAFNLTVETESTDCPFPVDCSGNCFINCPQDSIDEGEPFCENEYVDTFNGGCGSSPPVFGQLSNGDVVCGNSGTFVKSMALSRDVDWYEFTLDEEADVTWRLRATYLVETFILTPGCGSIAAFAIDRGGPCQQMEINVRLDPGTYTILIEPQFFSGVPCDTFTKWLGELSWTPTENNGACCLDIDTCVETTSTQCAAMGGGFAAPGILCGQVICDSCPEDVNRDGVIDVFDFADLADGFGMVGGATRADGDINLDGNVDVFDFADLADAFGESCPTL